MLPKSYFLASSQVSLYPNNKQQDYNTVTTKRGGDVKLLIIFNYDLSILATAFFADSKIGIASSKSFWQFVFNSLTSSL